MAFKSKTVTVGATATLLSDAAEGDFIGGSDIAVSVPTGGATVYVGGPDVTASGATQGWPVAAGEKFSTAADPLERLYGIVASGTQSVNVFLRGV